LEAAFFISKISSNGDPKINPLTLSKGFFMKIFNNFGKKKSDVWRGWGRVLLWLVWGLSPKALWIPIYLGAYLG
jgi:hypothetical protein